jgi:hypothetical protein
MMCGYAHASKIKDDVRARTHTSTQTSRNVEQAWNVYTLTRNTPTHRLAIVAMNMQSDGDMSRKAFIALVLAALGYEYVVSTRDRFMMLKRMESEMKIGVESSGE